MTPAASQVNLRKSSVLRFRPATLIAIAVIAFLMVVPLFANAYSLSNYRDVLLFALFALSLDIFWGKTGILSFGHATFFGLGAYGMSVTAIHLNIDPYWVSTIGLLIGLGLAAATALLVGYFILYGGVRGAYFTIVTLALTMVAHHIAVGWSEVTGGDSGMIGVPPFSILGFSFSDPIASYYLALFVLAVSLFVAMWIMNGRLGLILTAIQDDESKVQTLGYKTQFILLMTFVVSATLASLAGALYVSNTGFVAPDMIALLLSTEVIIWVAVGGSGTLIGAVIGTAVVWWLQQKISSISFAAWPIAIGTFFILLVLVFPQGPASYILNKIRLLKKPKGDAK